jgi:hypothetical protein
MGASVQFIPGCALVVDLEQSQFCLDTCHSSYFNVSVWKPVTVFHIHDFPGFLFIFVPTFRRITLYAICLASYPYHQQNCRELIWPGGNCRARREHICPDILLASLVLV